MREIRVNNGIATILREGDHGRLIGTVGGSEGARSLEHGKSEVVFKPYDGLGHIAAWSRFDPTEHQIFICHTLLN